MKTVIWVLMATLAFGVLMAGCGSSPQSKQVKAAQEADQVWKAHEFAKESKLLVKPGMSVREVIKTWGAPVKKSSGANKYMKWTYKVENIMYYRGWDSKKGAREQGTMIVEFQDETVTNVIDKP